MTELEHVASPTARRWTGVRLAAGVVVAVVWTAMMALIVTVGACDAFGGTCDGTNPPLLDDDVAGGAFFTTASASWLIWWLVRPSKRSVATGAIVALVCGSLAALATR